MRKKLFIGTFLIAIAGIVAGEYLFNRSGAQDAPKKADEKKDVLPTLPALPAPTVAKDLPPAFPPLTVTQDPIAPPSPPKATPPDQVPGKANDPPTLVIPPPVVSPQAFTPPAVAEQKKFDTPPTSPTSPQQLEFPSLPETKVKSPVQPTKEMPPVRDEMPKKPAQDPLLEFPGAGSLTPGTGQTIRSTSQDPNIAAAAEVAKLKGCPWTLQVEMIEGQTVVTATVNKKHEFKIVCKTLDLQTGKGTLKASGKVTITGDAFNGSCEHLSIPLMEDRLVLEGGSSVTIQKLTTNVSDTKPAAFELKGDTLNLRISELPGGNYMQTSWRPSGNVDGNVKQAATVTTTPSLTDKKWSPYGKLVRNEARVGPEWRLEKSNGDVIAYLVAREGGALDRFAGQTISVYGTTEDLRGNSVLRVTHIALP